MVIRRIWKVQARMLNLQSQFDVRNSKRYIKGIVQQDFRTLIFLLTDPLQRLTENSNLKVMSPYSIVATKVTKLTLGTERWDKGKGTNLASSKVRRQIIVDCWAMLRSSLPTMLMTRLDCLL